jgi:hypothetical protein
MDCKKKRKGLDQEHMKREGSQEIDAKSGQGGNSCPVNG